MGRSVSIKTLSPHGLETVCYFWEYMVLLALLPKHKVDPKGDPSTR